MSQLQELKEQCDQLGVKYTNKATIAQLQNKIKTKQMKIETKNGNITQEQIDAWKKEYGKVHILKVTVTKDKDGKAIDQAIGYIRKPKRNHKATAMSMYAQNKIMECGEFLRDNCWLGGDPRLQKDGDVADTAAIQAQGIVQFLEAELGEA